MENWVHVWGWITVIVCLAGIYLEMFRIMRYSGDNSVIAQRIVKVVFSDILIYGVTAFFWLATFVGVDLDMILYPARALFFAANVFFAYQLLQPIEK